MPINTDKSQKKNFFLVISPAESLFCKGGKNPKNGSPEPFFFFYWFHINIKVHFDLFFFFLHHQITLYYSLSLTNIKNVLSYCSYYCYQEGCLYSCWYCCCLCICTTMQERCGLFHQKLQINCLLSLSLLLGLSDWLDWRLIFIIEQKLSHIIYTKHYI